MYAINLIKKHVMKQFYNFKIRLKAVGSSEESSSPDSPKTIFLSVTSVTVVNASCSLSNERCNSNADKNIMPHSKRGIKKISIKLNRVKNILGNSKIRVLNKNQFRFPLAHFCFQFFKKGTIHFFIFRQSSN